MDLVAKLYHAVEKLSVGQTAAAGGAGAGISLAMASVEPGAWTPWLQAATLGVGLLTGPASLVLVLMKLVQQHRTMRRQ